MGDVEYAAGTVENNLPQKSNKNTIYVIGLILIIGLLVSGAIVIGLNRKKIVQQGISTNKNIILTPTLTLTQENIAIKNLSDKFLKNIQDIQISDQLMVKLQKDPLFVILPTERKPGEFIVKNSPHLQGLSLDQARIEYKKYLLSISTNAVGTYYTRGEELDIVNQELITQSVYMGRIYNSPYMTSDDKKSWRETILSMKDITILFAQLVGDAGFKQRTEDWWKSDVYKGL